MTQRIDQAQRARDQYKDGHNLRARTSFYSRFGTSKEEFIHWSFGCIEAPADAQVIELGTGFANLWVQNRDRIPSTWHITLTDLSPGMVAEAQQAVRQIRGQFVTQVADAQALEFTDQTFDVVIANHVIQHVPAPEKAIAEIRRVLKVGGRFYAATNGPEHLIELQDFIKKYITQESSLNLKEAFGFGKPFSLIDGPAMLKKHFETVKVHRMPNGLEVTETEPLVQFILSRIGWKTLVTTVGEEQAERIIAKTRVEITRRLADGPIKITTDAGLLEAF
jgi:ubiquinone/menaquinone biosynthesis C-methylase UbiE